VKRFIDTVQNFLNKNDLKLVIRSHEVKDQGYEIQHGNNLITVFSAPNYWYEYKKIFLTELTDSVKNSDQMGNKVLH